MDFAILPPEINSGRMYAGPGSGPTLAAAATWDGQASELHSLAASYGSVISGLTAGPWRGPASAAMAAAAGPYVTWMRTTATQAEQTATQAKAAAAAYEVAFAATVPPPVIAANRAQLTALVATNLFGQNTPAIAATETHYAEMWAQDAAAMYGYAGISASATTLTPFTPPPQSTNPGGLGGQAAALAQATATPVATNTQTMLAQLTSAVPTALKGLAAPLSSTSAAGLPVIPQSLAGILQTLGMSLLSPSTILEPSALGLGSSELTTASGAWAKTRPKATTRCRPPRMKLAWIRRHLPSKLPACRVKLAGSTSWARQGQRAQPVLGQAASVGALSVPPGWTAATPAIRLAAVALPGLGAAPEVFAGSPGSLFSQMALASMAGRAIGGSVSPGHRERIGATTRACPAPTPKSPGGPTTGIAEMREVTELLCKLGSLRDSGILTGEEFNEQKRRLLDTAPASL
ncbi:PPE family protein, SVP subgroup [Mycobacterium sp.]|uniref:PPE family protein, SVP subgroup n=1 Tax=Mycobacterium sp. TaxID=1785 RepID=UPI003F980888